MSLQQLHFLFHMALPELNKAVPAAKCLLDVGSRLGAVLYAVRMGDASTLCLLSKIRLIRLQN